MAAWPSRIAMSDAEPLPGGVKVMLGPVGNSPGPDLIVNVTVTLLLRAFPLASTTVTYSHASSVPSTAESVVVLDVSFSSAGVPATGHVGGGTLRLAFRYQ
jgi:hypothetical protein